MTDTVDIIVWDGTPAYHGGYLACEPEVRQEPLVYDPPPVQAKLSKGPRPHDHSKMVKKLDGVLSDEPMTVPELMEALRWRYSTLLSAIYWFRTMFPGELKAVPMPRRHRMGRHPLGYFVA